MQAGTLRPSLSYNFILPQCASNISESEVSNAGSIHLKKKLIPCEENKLKLKTNKQKNQHRALPLHLLSLLNSVTVQLMPSTMRPSYECNYENTYNILLNLGQLSGIKCNLLPKICSLSIVVIV